MANGQDIDPRSAQRPEKRERVIQYVYDRYGKHGAAMTANVITYRGRSAAREVGKVLGFESSTLVSLSKLAPMWGWKDPKDKIDTQFNEAGLDLNHPRSWQVHGTGDRHSGFCRVIWPVSTPVA